MSLPASGAEQTAFRGPMLHVLQNPALASEPSAAFAFFADGLLIVEQGKVVAFGAHSDLQDRLGIIQPQQLPDEALLLPGFVDTHMHYPQKLITAAYGEQLLDWLNNYTFNAEMSLADKAVAAELSRQTLREMLAYGTTTAASFCTVHPHSVDAWFGLGEELGMRLIGGKVLMDRHAPDRLLDASPELSIEQSSKLIERWHRKGRMLYAITPRFAPTSSATQLRLAGELFAKHRQNGVLMQTHLAENLAELEWVKELFPGFSDYLAVYEHFGLTGEGAIFGHAVHLEAAHWQRLGKRNAAVAFAPMSNGFLGSGLFDYRAAVKHGVRVGLASDIGAGDSLSMLKVYNEAYKVGQLRGHALDAIQGLYLMTLGAAEVLGLQHSNGNLLPGKDADFVIVNPIPSSGAAGEVITRRLDAARARIAKEGWPASSPEAVREQLFPLMMLGGQDPHLVRATYVAGRRIYDASASDGVRYPSALHRSGKAR